MIPRPQTDAAVRHNPGRWVCNTKPEKCGGIYRVYGQDMPCPLRAKCYWGGKNTYEWTWGRKEWGRYPEMDIDIAWAREHGTRLAQLQQVFAPHLRRKQRTSEQRERDTESQRRSRRKKAASNFQTFGNLMRRQPLPCGEDCENCPYDECMYTDQDLDAAEKVTTHKRVKYDPEKRKEQYERHKTRMETDPQYAERFRAKNAARCKRYYHKRKVKGKDDPHDKG